jgi:hypothetical protein
MLPLSPVEARINAESTPFHVFDSKPKFDVKTEIPGPPDSPSTQLRNEGQWRETVSPGSLPKNMAHLLET